MAFATDRLAYWGNDLNNLIKRLQQNIYLEIEWFEYNNINFNKDRRDLSVSGYKYENGWVKIGDDKIWESAKQNILEMKMGPNLNFVHYMSSLSKTSNGSFTLSLRILNKYKSL